MEGVWGSGSKHKPGCTCRICIGGVWVLGSKHIPGCNCRICNGGGMGVR